MSRSQSSSSLRPACNQWQVGQRRADELGRPDSAFIEQRRVNTPVSEARAPRFSSPRSARQRARAHNSQPAKLSRHGLSSSSTELPPWRTTGRHISRTTERAAAQPRHVALTPGGPRVSQNCPICLESIPAQSKTVLECSHSFHSFCIENWLTAIPTCPLCRIHVSGLAVNGASA